MLPDMALGAGDLPPVVGSSEESQPRAFSQQELLELATTSPAWLTAHAEASSS